jgi:hypothetical protein
MRAAGPWPSFCNRRRGRRTDAPSGERYFCA